jgi:hypothetical protein
MATVACRFVATLSFSQRPEFTCMLALTFVLAPLPNAVFSHCGSDEFASAQYESSGPIDLGRFLTSVFVVTGFALPIVLAHSEIITTSACAMSIVGGGCASIDLPF